MGHFKDLPHGDSAEIGLADARGKLAEHLVAPVVGYLNAGSTLAAAAGHTFDELDPARPEIAPLAILTDGEWFWPSDLPYYVETYRVGVPEEFLRHAEASGWRPPQLSLQRLVEIAEEM
ncbi:hypothetical protein ACTWLT_13005 [Micromonospora sp. ZYX-F-536]|uniref:hypothetical protein n=1 Tax=Micromonospora sp. ZYX-F-536 TaxID=3457629 RepID=UPI004040B7E4